MWIIAMGMMFLLPGIALAEETNPGAGTPASGGQTTDVVSGPAKPALSDFGIQNFQSGGNRVVWTHKSSYSKGADGFQMEVSEVKSGKIVSNEESSDLFIAKRDVLYRYRIRYYNGISSSEPRVYGEWSDYRYFCVPSLSGTRGSGGFEIKWKKVSNVKGYDCYIKVTNSNNRRSSGKMVAATFPARNMAAEGFKKFKTLGKNSTSLTIKKVGKQKLDWKKYYSVIVRPRFYVGGKKVTNDLDSWVYK